MKKREHKYAVDLSQLDKHLQVLGAAPEWIALLAQEEKEKIMSMVTQADAHYGGLTPAARADIKHKLQINDAKVDQAVAWLSKACKPCDPALRHVSQKLEPCWKCAKTHDPRKRARKGQHHHSRNLPLCGLIVPHNLTLNLPHFAVGGHIFAVFDLFSSAELIFIVMGGDTQPVLFVPEGKKSKFTSFEGGREIPEPAVSLQKTLAGKIPTPFTWYHKGTYDKGVMSVRTPGRVFISATQEASVALKWSVPESGFFEILGNPCLCQRLLHKPSL